MCVRVWIWSYLNLQKVVAGQALVMHLMVGILRIATILVLNKSEPRKR